MNQLITAAFFLAIWTIAADCSTAQPALRKLEALIRGREADESARAAEQPEAEAGQEVGRGAEEAPPRRAKREPGYLGVIADDRGDQVPGVLVLEVLPGGPADMAGLRARDVITAVSTVPVRRMSDMAEILKDIPVGGEVTFQVLRGQRRHEIAVVLGRRPPAEQRRFEHLPTPAKQPPGPPVGPPEVVAPRGPQAVPGPAVIPRAAKDLAAQIEALKERIEQLERRVGQLERALALIAPADQGGAERPATAPVTVTVTYEGAPLQGARVTFLPETPGGFAALGVTDASGRAALTTFASGDGAVPGTYRVAISKTLPGSKGDQAVVRRLLPPKYASPETSALTVEVVQDGPNDIRFDLTD